VALGAIFISAFIGVECGQSTIFASLKIIKIAVNDGRFFIVTPPSRRLSCWHLAAEKRLPVEARDRRRRYTQIND